MPEEIREREQSSVRELSPVSGRQMPLLSEGVKMIAPDYFITDATTSIDYMYPIDAPSGNDFCFFNTVGNWEPWDWEKELKRLEDEQRFQRKVFFHNQKIARHNDNSKLRAEASREKFIKCKSNNRQQYLSPHWMS